MASARTAALTALERCRRSNAWSDAVLGGVMDAEGLDPRDRALCSSLCYGVMQNRLLLDYYIGMFCTTRTSRLEPKVLDILRISACQLLFLDRIPASAAVNEGVKLCRQLGFSRAAGMVNAVLRRIAEKRDALPAVRARSRLETLSIQYSCPLELTALFERELGEETEALLAAQNAAVPVTMQVNTCRSDVRTLQDSLQAHGISAEQHPFLPDCLLTKSVGDLSALEPFQKGEFYIQDAAAKLSVLAAQPCAGMRILDVCSAPGGKSFAAAVLSGGRAKIMACDLHQNKLARIERSAQRLGFGDAIHTRAQDGRVYVPEWEHAFDLVICDVPCSGLGVIRKKPDIRYRQTAEFAPLAQLQLEIVRNCARYVRSGGVLLYSTCTLRREENSGVVGQFLAENNSFSGEEFCLPGGLRSGDGQLQLWPHRHTTDGFFIAKLRRE